MRKPKMKSYGIKISEKLALPIDVMGEASQIYGIRGSGKTNTAKLIVECLLELGEQCVILDPTNAWWGLKASADGKSLGFPIYVLGGEQGDRSLLPGDGEIIATWIVQSRASVVLSLRHMRKGEQKRFALDFIETMYHLKGRAEYQTPVLVVIDEASTFIPQNIIRSGGKGKEPVEAMLVGAVEDIVRRGRVAGFGVCLVDQRPASVNKNVSTQAPLLIAHKIVAPTDRAALKAWTEEYGDPPLTKEFLSTLHSLGVKENSEAWIWWPSDDGTVFKRVKPLKAKTYDSSSTPRSGERRQKPKELAQANLESLDAALASTREDVVANEPKTLKAKVKELEEKLKVVPKLTGSNPVEIDNAVAAATRPLLVRIASFEVAVEQTKIVAARIIDAAEQLKAYASQIADVYVEPPTQETSTKGKGAGRQIIDQLAEEQAATGREARTSQKRLKTAQAAVEGELREVQQMILDAAAFFNTVNVSSPSLQHVGAFIGRNHNSGRIRGMFNALESGGFIVIDKDRIRLTELGRGAAKQSPRKSLAELHAMWLAKEKGNESAMLRVILSSHPRSISLDYLGNAIEKNLNSGRVRGALNKLINKGVVRLDEKDGTVGATSLLFPEGIS